MRTLLFLAFFLLPKLSKLTPRGCPDAAFEISLFPPYEIPNSYNGKCGIWLYTSNLLPGKGSKVSIQGVSSAFFPEGAVVCLSHPQKQLREREMGREGLSLPYVLGAGTGTSSSPCLSRKESLVPA